MKEIVQFIEFVGFDILLTGALVILAVALSLAVARSDDLADGLKKGLHSVVARWNELTVTGAAAVFIVASLFGHVFILLGDEVFDSDEILHLTVMPYLPSFGDMVSDGAEAWRGTWKEEDQLKTEAVSDAWRRLAVQVPLKALLRSHGGSGDCKKGEDGCQPCLRKKEDDCAKGLFQHAKAVIGEKGSAGTHERIRRERYAMEIFSVLFVGLVFLLLATLIGPIARGLASIRASENEAADSAVNRCPAKRDTVAKLKGVWRGLAWAIVLWFAIGLNLRLWSEQAMRYDRKLVHTYVMLASQGDPAFGIESPAKGNGGRGDGEKGPG